MIKLVLVLCHQYGMLDSSLLLSNFNISNKMHVFCMRQQFETVLC